MHECRELRKSADVFTPADSQTATTISSNAIKTNNKNIDLIPTDKSLASSS